MLEKHRTAVSINTRARRLGCKERKRATTASKSLEDARESGGHYRIAAHLRADEIRRLASLSTRLSAQNRAVRRACARLPLLHQDPHEQYWTCPFRCLHRPRGK